MLAARRPCRRGSSARQRTAPSRTASSTSRARGRCSSWATTSFLVWTAFILWKNFTRKAARPDAAGVPSTFSRREPARAAALSITRVRGDAATASAANRPARERSSQPLKRGAKALVFPGGAREVFKRKGEAYTLRWPSDSSALVRIAAKFNATIIPFAGVGGDEFFGNQAYALDTDDLLTMDNRVGEFLGNRTESLVISLVDGDTFVPPLMAPNAAPRRNYYLFGRPFTRPRSTRRTRTPATRSTAPCARKSSSRWSTCCSGAATTRTDFVKRLAYEVGRSRLRSLWTGDFVVMFVQNLCTRSQYTRGTSDRSSATTGGLIRACDR